MSDSTPLLNAVLAGDVSLVDTMLADGANVAVRDRSNDTPLHSAAAHGHVEIVDLLLRAGAEIDALNWDDETPLLAVLADGKRHHAVIQRLIAAGADVNAADSARVTPLMWAVTTKDPIAVGLLLEAGADLSCRDSEGDDIWDYARDEVVYSEEVYLTLLAGKDLQRASR